MASPSTDTGTIALPFDMVCKSAGFSADIGGSVAKIVYRDILDWDFERNEPKKTDGGLALVRTQMFPRNELDNVISFIREHCKLTPKSREEDILVYTTGVGCHQFIKEIEQKLNVRIKNLTEMDCFVKAFRFLSKHLPEKQFLHDHSKKAVDKSMELNQQMDKLLSTMQDMDFTEGKIEIPQANANVPERGSQEDGPVVYPILLGMLGSAFGYMKLEADGTFGFVDGSNRGGRLLLGLGSLLTGTKSYAELVNLAEAGDSNNVHTLIGELQRHERDEHEDFYGVMPADAMAFCFGKTVNKSIADFKKEDIAAALVQTLCLDVTHIIDHVMHATGTTVVYLCGGYANMSHMREKMTEAYLSRAMLRGLTVDGIRFVKNGGYLGALGAFMEGYA